MNEFSILLNPLILLPNSLLVFFDCFALLFFYHWVKTGQRKKATALLLAKPITSLASIYFVISQFGGGFFMGAWYLFISFVIALIMFSVWLVKSIRLRKESSLPPGRYWFSVGTGLILVLSILVPTFVYAPITEACAANNIGKVQMISRALEQYRAENGRYPIELGQLESSSQFSLPSPSCNWLSGQPREFRVRICDGERPLIIVTTIDLLGYDFYTTPDGTHTRLHSFLDNPDPAHCATKDFLPVR